MMMMTMVGEWVQARAPIPMLRARPLSAMPTYSAFASSAGLASIVSRLDAAVAARGVVWGGSDRGRMGRPTHGVVRVSSRAPRGRSGVGLELWLLGPGLSRAN